MTEPLRTLATSVENGRVLVVVIYDGSTVHIWLPKQDALALAADLQYHAAKLPDEKDTP